MHLTHAASKDIEIHCLQPHFMFSLLSTGYEPNNMPFKCNSLESYQPRWNILSTFLFIMKENIKYMDKRTANVGQDRPILTRMHIPNTASGHSVRNAPNSSLVCSIIIFFHYRKSCKWVIRVLNNNKSWCNKEPTLWFLHIPWAIQIWLWWEHGMVRQKTRKALLHKHLHSGRFYCLQCICSS